MIRPFTLLNFVNWINEFLPIGTPSFLRQNKFCHIFCEWMHRHPFTNYCRLSGVSAPGRAKYPEHKTQFCAMGVFRSQTPRALRNASYIYHCPAYAFHFGRIRPVFLPVSGLIFSLTTTRLFLFFLFALIWYPCPYIPDLRSMAFLPDTILSTDSFPFLSVPTDHQPILPGIPHSEILYQSISL